MLTISTYFEDREAKAVAKAEKKAKESLVLKLIEMGKMTIDEIAACSGLTLRRVKTLASQIKS